MLEKENIINLTEKKSKNKLYYIFSTVIKSILVLLILGIIMLWLSTGASEVYIKCSYNRNYTGGWGYHEYLNPVYGLIGIITYILINYLGFISYNYITNKFKNCKILISKIMFIIFNIFTNIIMLIIYSNLFGSYSFQNILLEFLNKIILVFGWITFPIMFIIIYIYRRNLK